MKKIGAFEAKTHLSHLLERVANGEQFVITRHGKDVAQLIPAQVPARADAAAAVRQWRQRRAKVRLRGPRVRDLINHGRR